ncbi:hypothetical protein ABW20_dc0103664 [Dactylellina cionopaga]|nr:hypothetical protein ABW20_dc0103664 [Dactylellina cionopaga]
MNTFRVLKIAVTDVATTQSGARIGVLHLAKGFTLPTPNYIAPTSRGVVPHLSPDNLEKNTGVVGVYVALEDFIEKAPQRVPPLYTYPNTLREFISLPTGNFLLLSPRRSPALTCPKSNSDANVSILTSVGFRDLPIKDYVSAVVKLQPDIVLGIADSPNSEKPGKSRIPKIPVRTEKWLEELLGKVFAGVTEGDRKEDDKEKEKKHIPAVFAAVLPLEIEKQRLYVTYLQENVDRLTGLVFNASAAESLARLPEELQDLARLQSDAATGPHEVLEMIDRGVDIFNIGFTGLATDAGIALHFKFGTSGSVEEEGEDDGGVPLHQLDLATNMWDEKFATDLGPLEEGCECYACTRHHKAYIRHCLEAKEMTAWVLLQIHNLNVIERFFRDVRRCIEDGRWEVEKERFGRKYVRALPEGTGSGPRLRGYQYKSSGGDKKLNEPAYRSLESAAGPDEDEGPQMDAAGLQKSGFAQVADGF